MGRGVSSGGGQSSLGYLFGSGESPKPTPKNVSPSTGTVNEVPQTQNEVVKETPPPAVVPKDIPAGIPGNNANNYFRADGQNCGNFLTGGDFVRRDAARALELLNFTPLNGKPIRIMSCVKKGYMKDDYIHLFVRRPVRRSPIINRGYFARWAAFRKLLYQFLDCEGSNSEKGKTKRQILSLGVGFDTTYFQLQDEGKAPYLIRGTRF